MASAGAPGHLRASSSALRPSAAPFFAITRHAKGLQAMRCNVGSKATRSSLGFTPLMRAVRPSARIQPATRALPSMDSARGRSVICEPCSTSAGSSMLASPLRARGCHPDGRGLRRAVAAAGSAAPLLACLSSVSAGAQGRLKGAKGWGEDAWGWGIGSGAAGTSGRATLALKLPARRVLQMPPPC